ncbi:MULTISPECIES: hypothetical protein [unclassified Paenibacillus]|uniref:hypothetical protein n=1 Tax=unclassified Paenibacillus TaxID=185978 RepID=UPI0004F8D74A|nr:MULTISPECIES: hypothetical protein [unclassified Paenibacillus]AIQ32518.1 hypothetical protein P40081_33765 [Paenibacillus sp. FSL P4-0081]
MQIGRRLYYELTSGNIIQDTGERSGDVIETTQEQDFGTYKALAERTPETVGVLELEYGEYSEDFARCNGYRIEPTTLKIKFSYPDPNMGSGGPTEPIYQKPLTEMLATLEQRTEANEAAILALLDFGL